MKIGIVGWFNCFNVGDDCFKLVFQQFFRNHDIQFVRPPDVCKDVDIVILGGGAVASPYYLRTLPDVPRYALGIDIAYKSEIDLLKEYNFREIYVRNSTDLPEMKAKLNCPVHSMPDLAFYLQPTGADVLGKYKKFKDKKTIGIFVTDYVNPAIDRSVEKFSARAADFKAKLVSELDWLSSEYEIVLIPCSTGGYGDDRRMNLDLAAFMRNSPTNIMDYIDPQSIIDLTNQLHMAICMRFHSHIFAMITRTPFISIQFTRKVSLLLDEKGFNKTTAVTYDGQSFDFSNFRNVLDKNRNLYVEPNNHRVELETIRTKVLQEWLGESV